MIHVKDIKTKRFEFLYKLYEETGGTKRKTSTQEDIGGKLGLDFSETDGIVDYLSDEGLIDYKNYNMDVPRRHKRDRGGDGVSRQAD